jgi:hypothetical protein
MMEFRTVKNKIVEILGDAENGRYRTVGFRRQSKSGDEILNNDRLVQVYFSEGQFQKSHGRFHGEKTHDVTFEIELSASAKAHGDLTVLDSPTATPIAKAAAIAAIKEASEIADNKIDELIDIIYNILMDARNEGLQLDKGDVSSRWIDRIQKDILLERGDLVVKTANMKYTCRVIESVPGDIGTMPDKIITDSDFTGDISSAGVKTNETN